MSKLLNNIFDYIYQHALWKDNSGNVTIPGSLTTGSLTTGSLTIGTRPINDFVIENGATTMTTNLPVVWRWRKWNSGYMEAWGRYEVSNVSFSSTTTGYYAVIGTANFPMELKEAPYCQATVDFGNTGSISTSSLSKTSVTLAVWSASTQSRTCNISLYIMAKYQFKRK